MHSRTCSQSKWQHATALLAASMAHYIKSSIDLAPTFEFVCQADRDWNCMQDSDAGPHGPLSVQAAVGEQQQEERQNGKDGGDEQNALHAHGTPQGGALVEAGLLLLRLCWWCMACHSRRQQF